jgi:hypothetical protein
MTDDVDTMVADIIANYDNTETTTLQNPTTRTARIVSYMQRAAEELWYHRAWPFAMDLEALVMSGGEASLPTDFARVGPEGALLDPNGKPWVEIAFQDMAYLRTRGLRQADHLFCIGSKVQVVNVASTQTFTLVYQLVAPTIATGGTTGFPIPFSHAFLLGTVMKLKEEEGDAREIWRRDYQMALARATALWTQASRPQRMPKTLPGRMW